MNRRKYSLTIFVLLISLTLVLLSCTPGSGENQTSYPGLEIIPTIEPLETQIESFEAEVDGESLMITVTLPYQGAERKIERLDIGDYEENGLVLITSAPVINLEVIDDSSNLVTSFEPPMTLEVTFTPNIKNKAVDLGYELILGFYDETQGMWKPIHGSFFLDETLMVGKVEVSSWGDRNICWCGGG